MILPIWTGGLLTGIKSITELRLRSPPPDTKAPQGLGLRVFTFNRGKRVQTLESMKPIGSKPPDLIPRARSRAESNSLGGLAAHP